jgi:hypothetical protein
MLHLTYLLAREPGRKHIRIDVVSEDSESMRYDQMGGSEGKKKREPEINEVLGELLREIRALKEEVSRICGDTASIVTTICGDTASEVPIGVGRNRHSGLCSLCCPRVHKRYLHEMDPNQGSQFPGIHYD